jgi:hypothetical protein
VKEGYPVMKRWGVPAIMSPICTLVLTGCSLIEQPWDRVRALPDEVRLTLQDKEGRPIQHAEVWCDDGQSVQVGRIRPEVHEVRFGKGDWAAALYDTHVHPGQWSWCTAMRRNAPPLKMLRIVVLPEGKPPAFFVRWVPEPAPHVWEETLILEDNGPSPCTRNVNPASR